MGGLLVTAIQSQYSRTSETMPLWMCSFRVSTFKCVVWDLCKYNLNKFSCQSYLHKWLS